MWIDHILFVHSSVDGHLDSFYFLAIVNNSAANVHVRDFLWALAVILLGKLLGVNFWVIR